MFNLEPNGNGRKLKCYDKFGREINVQKREPLDITQAIIKPDDDAVLISLIKECLETQNPKRLLEFFSKNAASWDYNKLRWVISRVGREARANSAYIQTAADGLTLVLDRHFPFGNKKRSALTRLVTEELYGIFDSFPKITDTGDLGVYTRVDFRTRNQLRPPIAIERYWQLTLAILSLKEMIAMQC